MMTRKICITLLILVTFYVWNEKSPLQAEIMNVTDCLEANEDCLEQELDEELEQEEDETDSELLSNLDSTTTPTSMVFNIVKMFFALLLVLALIYGILIILRRRNKLHQHSDMLENLGGIPLGTNRSIQLIRVGSSIYMVGVGENVEMLQEVTDEEVKTLLLEKEENSQTSASSLIQNFLQNRIKDKPNESDDTFSNKLQSELKKIRFNRKNMIEHHKKKDDEHV